MVEKEVIGPGIVVYKNALTKDLCLAERLEAALEKEGSRFKWSGARVAYHNTDTNHRNCQDFKYTKQSLGEIDECVKSLGHVKLDKCFRFSQISALLHK